MDRLAIYSIPAIFFAAASFDFILLQQTPEFHHHLAVVSAGLGAIAAVFLIRFFAAVERGDPPSIERHFAAMK